jgi:uncharacterized tellurite resistance protein B-like protein
MSPPADPEVRIRHLATLFLMMAQGGDDHFSASEIDTIVERMAEREVAVSRDRLQEIIGEVRLGPDDDPFARAAEASAALVPLLDAEARAGILKDLAEVAQSDGIILEDEVTLLKRVAATWDQPLPSTLETPRHSEPLSSSQEVLVHLAYIYLVLAHGTDHELSPRETQVIGRKLDEWKAGGEPDTPEIMQAALSRYSRSANEVALNESVEIVHSGLSREKRARALRDLIEIANADGVFLDNEEDLINSLAAAWQVSPGRFTRPR